MMMMMMCLMMVLHCTYIGLFGMNLLSGFENHGSMFYVVTSLGGLVMISMLGLAIFYGSHAKLL